MLYLVCSNGPYDRTWHLVEESELETWLNDGSIDEDTRVFQVTKELEVRKSLVLIDRD
jgi:hypothetical protein